MNEAIINKGGWIGYGYCLKKHEYIDFYKVIKGFKYRYEIVNIGRIVERSYVRN